MNLAKAQPPRPRLKTKVKKWVTKEMLCLRVRKCKNLGMFQAKNYMHLWRHTRPSLPARYAEEFAEACGLLKIQQRPLERVVFMVLFFDDAFWVRGV